MLIQLVGSLKLRVVGTVIFSLRKYLCCPGRDFDRSDFYENNSLEIRNLFLNPSSEPDIELQ